MVPRLVQCSSPGPVRVIARPVRPSSRRAGCSSLSADQNGDAIPDRLGRFKEGAGKVGQDINKIRKNKAWSQIMQQKWKDFQRWRLETSVRSSRKISKAFWSSPAGGVTKKIWGKILWLTFPFQIIQIMVHMQMYKLSTTWQCFGIMESQREEEFENYYADETRMTNNFFSEIVYFIFWMVYYFFTPADLIWMSFPLYCAWSEIGQLSDIPKSGTIYSLVLIWFFKFPSGVPVLWI